MKKYLIVCVVLLLFATSAFASELKLDAGNEDIGINQQFESRLILDTQNRTINAVEGKVNFSSDFLELKEIRDGNSIVVFWVEKPSIVDNGIKFSGIIPGGYNGQDGLLFSLIFEAKKEGKPSIKLENAKVLLNDGSGTEDTATIKNLEFKIGKTGTASAPAISDNSPPENFKPLVSKDKNIFGGKWFLSFATEDKGSGIDYYHVQERWFWYPSDNKWIKAESSYQLKDQKQWSYVYVRAIDKAGNARLVVLRPANIYQIFIIFVIIVAVISLLLRRIYGRKKI